MARQGITYHQVAEAASQLCAEGKILPLIMYVKH